VRLAGNPSPENTNSPFSSVARPLVAGTEVCDTAASPISRFGEERVVSTAAAGGDRVAVERWAGEVRVNLVRLTALVAFYAYHLFDVYQNRDNSAYTPEYRAAVAAVVFAWAGVVVLAHAWLRRDRLPPALPILTTLADAVLVTALVTVSGGPKSTPLVLLYPLVVAAAPPRLSLRLVWLATVAAALGYVVALGHYVFVRLGSAAYYGDPAVRIPRSQEAITLLAILTAGLLAGQAVRQVLRLTGDTDREVGP
jgi:hypothetical protein